MHFEDIEFIKPMRLKAFSNHIQIIGKSGSGKGVFCEGLITKLIGKEKVIDLWDSQRNENMLYSLPEKNSALIQKMKEFSNGTLKPKGFPNDIYLIAGRRLDYIKTFPKNIKIVSLNENDLVLEDLFYLLGKNETSKVVLGFLQHTYGNMKIRELLNFLEEKKDKLKGIQTQSIFYLIRQIKNLLNSGMFNSNFEKLNLKKILNDKNTITSFSSYLLENENEEALFYGIILKKILNLKRKGLRIPITIYIREISNILGTYADKEMRLCQKQLLTILSQGRDLRLTLIADSQYSKQIPAKFRRQFGVHVAMRNDRKDAECLLEICQIPQFILNKMSRLGLGEALITDGSYFHYPVFISPTQHCHKKVGMNVFKELIKKYGSYTLTDEQIIDKDTIAISKENFGISENKTSIEEHSKSSDKEFIDLMQGV